MCKENCKCSGKNNQMREMLEDIVRSYEVNKANGKDLVLKSRDIEDIKEILEQSK